MQQYPLEELLVARMVGEVVSLGDGAAIHLEINLIFSTFDFSTSLPITIKMPEKAPHSLRPSPLQESVGFTGESLLLGASSLCFRRRSTWAMNSAGDIGGCSDCRFFPALFHSSHSARWESLRNGSEKGDMHAVGIRSGVNRQIGEVNLSPLSYVRGRISTFSARLRGMLNYEARCFAQSIQPVPAIRVNRDFPIRKPSRLLLRGQKWTS